MFRPFATSVFVILSGLAAIADAQVLLQQKYVENSWRKHRLTKLLDRELSLGGQDLNTKLDSTVIVASKNGERDAAGDLPVSIRFDSINADMELPGGVAFKFDSANPEVDSDNPLANIAVETFRKQLGSKMTYTLNKDNKVGEIRGIEEGSMINAKNLRRQYQEEADQFPADPVKVGDMWTRTSHSDIGNGLILIFERRYEYLGTVTEFPTVRDSRKLEKIGMKATKVQITFDPNGGLPVTVEKSDLKITSSKGMILFDRESGHIVSQIDNVLIQGSLELSAAGTPLEGTLSLEIKSKAVEVQ